MKHLNKSRALFWLMVLLANLSAFAQTTVTLPTQCNSCLSGIGKLNCTDATKSGDIMAGYPVNNVYYIPHHNAISVNSTGKTGLSAAIATGTFATGSGTTVDSQIASYKLIGAYIRSTGYREAMRAEFDEMIANNQTWNHGMQFVTSATNYEGIKHFGPNTNTPMISIPANGTLSLKYQKNYQS